MVFLVHGDALEVLSIFVNKRMSIFDVWQM